MILLKVDPPPIGGGTDFTLLRSGLGSLGRLGVLAAEALDAARGVNQLLLAGEERVAIRADFQVDIALVGGSRSKAVPAGAHDAYLVVSGMDLLFHCKTFLGSPGHTEPLREFSGKI